MFIVTDYAALKYCNGFTNNQLAFVPEVSEDKIFTKWLMWRTKWSRVLILGICLKHFMSHGMRFPALWHARPAKAQTSLRIRAFWSEHLLVAWIFHDCWTTGRISFGVSKLNMGLHRLVWVYTCQNVTLLEIIFHGSIIITALHWNS